jgi:hypothetical protein
VKSAYELAMERLGQTAPTKKLTAAQKARLAEIDSLSKSKLAQCELNFQNALKTATDAGDGAKMELLQARFAVDREKLEGEREAKKNRIREES